MEEGEVEGGGFLTVIVAERKGVIVLIWAGEVKGASRRIGARIGVKKSENIFWLNKDT